MDNKKWYKRISTCFWFLLATLPIIVAIFGFIGQYIGHIPDNYQHTSAYLGQYYYCDFSYYLQNCYAWVADLIPSFLKDTFVDLFLLIDNEMMEYFAIFSAWFCWVYFIELMVDFVVWLPRMCHSWIERWCVD